MDGVNLKPGWLNDGRSRANTFGSQPYGDLYRQGELLGGFGASDAGPWSLRPSSISTAPRSAGPPRPSSNLARGNAATARPGSQSRPSPPVVVAPPSASNVSTSWGNQSRSVPSSVVQPVMKQLVPPSGFSKSAVPTIRAPAPSPHKTLAPSPGRSMLNGTTLKAPAAVPYPQAGGDKDDQSKQRRQEKLEQRRRFLEELSRQAPGSGGKGDDEDDVVGDANKDAEEMVREDPNNHNGEGMLKGEKQVKCAPSPLKGKVEEKAVSKEEWDAKWRAMYGSFVAVSLCNGEGLPEGEDDGAADAEGGSLLTEEELATFKAAHGKCLNGIQRRPKQLVMTSGCYSLTSSCQDPADEEGLTSDEDSDDE